MFKNLDIPALRREIATEVKARTTAFAGRNFPEAAAPAKRSDKVTKIEELLATGAFGCNSASVAKALSIVVGEEITYNSRSGDAPRYDRFDTGVALVPNEGKSEWRSPWGVRAVVNGMSTSADYFTDSTGKVDRMSGRKVNSRPATAKEIDTLISEMPESKALALAVSLLASAPAKS